MIRAVGGAIASGVAALTGSVTAAPPPVDVPRGGEAAVAVAGSGGEAPVPSSTRGLRQRSEASSSALAGSVAGEASAGAQSGAGSGGKPKKKQQRRSDYDDDDDGRGGDRRVWTK